MRRLTAALVVAAIPLAAAPGGGPAVRPGRGRPDDAAARRGTAEVLEDAGVRVSPVAPASVGASGLTFPVTGGAADPRTLAGAVRHAAASASAPAGAPPCSVPPPTDRPRTSLSMLAGGDRLRVLALDTSGAKIRRAGLDTRASRIRATLTAAAARALNQAFGVHLFSAGLPIGTVRTEVAYRDVVSAPATPRSRSTRVPPRRCRASASLPRRSTPRAQRTPG